MISEFVFYFRKNVFLKIERLTSLVTAASEVTLLLTLLGSCTNEISKKVQL